MPPKKGAKKGGAAKSKFLLLTYLINHIVFVAVSTGSCQERVCCEQSQGICHSLRSSEVSDGRLLEETW